MGYDHRLLLLMVVRGRGSSLCGHRWLWVRVGFVTFVGYGHGLLGHSRLSLWESFGCFSLVWIFLSWVCWLCWLWGFAFAHISILRAYRLSKKNWNRKYRAKQINQFFGVKKQLKKKKKPIREQILKTL